ncbi:MAG: GNAT family N-acetyltransferase [Acidimicrobiia bacterium]|nr:GNAT family N-acetyltransferase [Acidimicrobiia bacterium]
MLSIAPLTTDDHDLVTWTLYEAVTWNDPEGVPPLETAIQHPEMVRYHTEWGRGGDLGVKATIDGTFAGAAFARLFTDDDHGYGYVDDETPELGIAAVGGVRNRGVGRRLMEGLATEARRNGVGRLSLSVNNANPAKRLYESLGYELVESDGDSSIMVLDL